MRLKRHADGHLPALLAMLRPAVEAVTWLEH